MGNASRVVLVTQQLEDRWVERIEGLARGLRIEQQPHVKVEDIPADLWREVEIICTYNILPTPEQAPRLSWVQLHSAGANHVLANPLLERGVTFTTASGVHAVNIAEYVFTTLLAWYHRFDQMLAWKQRGQ